MKILKKRKIPQQFVVLAFCALFTGCSGGATGKTDRPPTQSTKIEVRHNGTPVEKAVVTLVPQDREKGKAAIGTTNAEGMAVLKTFEDGDGAIVGDYVVTIQKTEAPPAAAPMPDTEDPAYDPEAANVPATQTKHLLPEKYSKVGQSGLKITIKEGSNTETFDLK